jgi:NACHT domain
MGILKDNVADGAFHNSNERFDPPKCYPNTRTAILDEIMSWVENSHSTSSSTPIMWLYGPAGAGKSAIVQTITEKCNALRWLAASFFFSRTAAGRNDEKRLIPTITYQLTLSIPGFRSLIEKEVEADPLIFSRSLEAQMRALIAIPLFKARRSEPERSWPMLIAIDGLDECHGDVAQRSILEVLFSALNEQGLFFCCLVASRPEQIIRQTFNRKHYRDASCRLVLDDSYSSEADIRHFLQSRFNEIKENHSLQALIPDSWPLQTDIETLVRKSSGQFIYASTVIKYVDSPKHRPHDRLNIILGISSPGSDTPFAELDVLYKQILSSADDLHCVLQILGALVLIRSGEFSPRGLEILFSLQEGDVFLALSDLHSILHVPEPPKQGDVRILHASLSDFLFDRSRAGELFIDTEQCHTELARCCVRLICSQNPTSITSLHEIVYHHTVPELMHQLKHSLLTQELLDDLGLIDLGMVLRRTRGYWKGYLIDLLSWCKSLQVQVCSTHFVTNNSDEGWFFTEDRVGHNRSLYSPPGAG